MFRKATGRRHGQGLQGADRAYLVKRGLRNAFLGAGLCAMFAWWDADFLAGIGALVFIYGIGQTVIGSLPAIKDWWKNRHGDQGTGYNGTPV